MLIEYTIAHSENRNAGIDYVERLKLRNGFGLADLEGFLEELTLNKGLKAWLVTNTPTEGWDMWFSTLAAHFNHQEDIKDIFLPRLHQD